MKNIDIIIFIEHLDREIIVSKLLKFELEKLGLKVIIASIMYETPSILYNYKPKAIITPYIGFGKNSICDRFSKVYNTEIKYFNINYEQILFPFTGSFKVPKYTMAKEHQINFCWGENFKEFLLNSGVLKENLFISGRPYSAAIKAKNNDKVNIRKSILKNNKLQEDRKIIFIALTDSLAMNDFKKVERIVKKDGDYSALKKQIEWDKNTIIQLLRIIESFKHDESFNHYNIVLRPHPTIEVKDYQKLINTLNIDLPNNFFILKNSDAISWLISCDYFITNYSTLILDAIEINKPVFTINSNDTSEIEYLWLVNHTNSPFSNISDLKNLLLNRNQASVERVDSNWIRDINAITEIAQVVSSQLSDFNFSTRKPTVRVSDLPYLVKKYIYKFWRKNLNNAVPLIKKSKAIDYFEIIK